MAPSSTPRRRRSIRLPEYDYSRPGAYFVTICAHERQCLFGEVVGEAIRSNRLGDIVSACWMSIPEHAPHVQLDAFVVMPNHLHGILLIAQWPPGAGPSGPSTCGVGAQHAAPLPTPDWDAAAGRQSRRLLVAPGSLGAIVRSFKSAATRRINQERHRSGARVWQRNYFEHVIRNDAALYRLRECIAENPRRWHLDPENPDP